MNHQGRRNGAKNRRKNSQKTNKNQEQQQNTNSANHSKSDEEQTRIVTNNDENNHEISEHYSDEEQDDVDNYQDSEQRLPTHVEEEQQPKLDTKQRHKTKIIYNSSSNFGQSYDDSIQSAKPQASVAPVKQPSASPPGRDTSNHVKFSSNRQDYYYSQSPSSSSYNNYSYSSYNSLPPRFQRQQQQQQRERGHTPHRHRRRRGGGGQYKRSSFSPESAERNNEFIPSSATEQRSPTPPPTPPPQQQQQQPEQPMQQQQPQMYYNQVEASPVEYMQRPEFFMHNGYSSESDIVTDSSQMVPNTSMSSVLSTPTSSESSLQRLDLVRSLSSHGLLEELIAIFDTISFSSDELELILNKIATKHVLDKHDVQRILASAKNDKTFERILEETYRSQAKILAIELQTEKNRVLELTKSNSDLESTIRQFQQQQPNNIAQYQQLILPYQMQLRRLADENSRLQHQLHAYAMLPATLNELKQQHHILTEQVRQITLRNSALENEAAESQRASKHAAEIYKKADTQKQERIEQMIADINKYRKLDKELSELRQKHTDLEKNLNEKISEITSERDQLKEKCETYGKQNPALTLQQQIDDLKRENDELRQKNWKTVEQLNQCLDKS